MWGHPLYFDLALQAYLVTLVDTRELVARVARRFMPRLKTESEVATMHYLRQRTSIPVPDVYYYDPNPYNRLGGEYILMSKVRLIIPVVMYPDITCYIRQKVFPCHAYTTPSPTNNSNPSLQISQLS